MLRLLGSLVLLCLPGGDRLHVRNSLPTRSSLDGGGKAWVLKAEVGGGYDESNEEGNDNGLDRQRC